ncbi:type II secretion system F family protein [Nocardiopsis suaedae]|uniref:Type II secretion system F family protein n=1 Tax=Nocardiopsis suaedae TaxID=3018444 RepID=A0ABT4TUA5_9ACTN|nr:type II secretion system F family protein [Nocardiopsis suaedae]MDA2808222.1 type II secretion system F family protein [Nocardiopsis suaedae]
MTAILGAVVVVFGTCAVRLLLFPGPSIARLRLEARLRPGPQAERAVPDRGIGRLGAAGVVLAPVLALAIVTGPGAAFLFGPPLGAVLWLGLRRVAGARARQRDARIAAGLPLALDLLVAGVRAGGETGQVLSALSRSIGGPLGEALAEVAERQRLGAAPDRAWRAVGGPPELAALGRTLTRAAETGAPVGDLVAHHAAEARRAAHGRALARTQRTAVLVVAPLGLCFLPAFVLIGVVPLVASLVGGLVGP